MFERKFHTLYDEAIAATEDVRQDIIQAAYIDKLEKRVMELEDRPQLEITPEQVSAVMYALDQTQLETMTLCGRIPKTPMPSWKRVRLLRAAYNLSLEHAQRLVNDWIENEQLPF